MICWLHHWYVVVCVSLNLPFLICEWGRQSPPSVLAAEPAETRKTARRILQIISRFAGSEKYLTVDEAVAPVILQVFSTFRVLTCKVGKIIMPISDTTHLLNMLIHVE